MNRLRLGLLILATLVPFAANADIRVGDLPANTVWYFHANLAEMRTGDAGKQVYAWFDDEVGDEVREETGIDISAEVDTITAFSNNSDGTIIVVEGPLTKATRDKILALAAQEGPVDPREYKDRTYYFFGNEDDIDDNGNEPFEDLKDALFVSFALDRKALITGTEAQMQDLLDNGGRVTGAGSHAGALLVLSANKSLVQAGVNTRSVIDNEDYDNDDWESNIMRNTREAALLMADTDGRIAVEAQLVSTDPKMAEAIGGIVSGLIGLQAFNSELGPDIQNLIRNTKVEVANNVLSINTVIDPDLVVRILND